MDDGAGAGHRRQHFLIVAYGVQSHVNPGRALARRLARLDVGGRGTVLATLSLPLFAHRRIFPSSTGEEADDGVVRYTPYSDGFDDGTMPMDAEGTTHGRRTSFESISAIVARLAALGEPVTCIVSSMIMLPALDVGREHGIPLAVSWIQPATVLAVAYHYFHGYEHVVASHAGDATHQVSLPGLRRPLRIRDFPSFLVDTEGNQLLEIIKDAFEELFRLIDEGKANVLVNTFGELEAAPLAEMKRHLDVFAVGPMVGSSSSDGEAPRLHLFNHDAGSYTAWLDARPARSVVYVSFGSILKHSRRQAEEILHGLRRCGWPFLLVSRKDGLQEDVDAEVAPPASGGSGGGGGGDQDDDKQDQGMVVEWCDQLEVLSHPAVGCFVTHCGWNSTLEAVVLGVPVVAAPSWMDQPTNAFLVEEEWEVGARAERGCDGVLAGAELARCIEVVMGDGERGTRIRERAEAMKEMARAVGGTAAEGNLFSFVMAAQASYQAGIGKACACQNQCSPIVEMDR